MAAADTARALLELLPELGAVSFIMSLPFPLLLMIVVAVELLLFMVFFMRLTDRAPTAPFADPTLLEWWD